MEIVRKFPPELYASALEDWVWIAPELGSLEPTHTTAFGDVFLRGSDGAFWFLDAIEGSLTRIWASGEELQSVLNTPEGQDRFLMIGLLQQATDAGLAPGDAEVLSFKVPPVLGGAIGLPNVEVSDFVVALSMAGQIQEQIRELPPGADISGATLQ